MNTHLLRYSKYQVLLFPTNYFCLPRKCLSIFIFNSSLRESPYLLATSPHLTATFPSHHSFLQVRPYIPPVSYCCTTAPSPSILPLRIESCQLSVFLPFSTRQSCGCVASNLRRQMSCRAQRSDALELWSTKVAEQEYRYGVFERLVLMHRKCAQTTGKVRCALDLTRIRGRPKLWFRYV